MTEERLFKTGERVEVSRPIDLLPYTVLVPGERGTVVKLIDDMGIHAIEVEMDTRHEGLAVFQNRALLTWPETAYLTEAKVKQRLRTVVATFAWGGLVTGLGTLKAHAAAVAVVAHGFLTLGIM